MSYFNHPDLDPYDRYLTAYWKLEEDSGTRMDSIGDNDLFEVGPLGSENGKNGKALSFDGVSYIRENGASYDLTPYSSFAISCWVKVDTSGSSGFDLEIISKSGSYMLDCQFASSSSCNMLFGVVQNNGHVVYSNSIIAIGTWHHVVGVVYSHKVRCYINGVFEGEDDWDGSINSSSNSVVIGHSMGSVAINGAIDEMAFWKDLNFGSFTAQDKFAEALYNNGSGLFLGAEDVSSSSSDSSSSYSSSSDSSSSSPSYNLSSNFYYSEDYKYGFFKNDKNNLLNTLGGMTGPGFSFPENVNVVFLTGYSGDNVHNLKLENKNTGQIMTTLIPGEEIQISEVMAGEELRVIVNDGSAGDVVNSYEVKFRKIRFTSDSSSEDKSFLSHSTESTASSESSASSDSSPSSQSSDSSQSSESSASSKSSVSSKSSESSASSKSSDSSQSSESSPSSDSSDSSQSSESSPLSDSSASSQSSESSASSKSSDSSQSSESSITESFSSESSSSPSFTNSFSSWTESQSTEYANGNGFYYLGRAQCGQNELPEACYFVAIDDVGAGFGVGDFVKLDGDCWEIKSQTPTIADYPGFCEPQETFIIHPSTVDGPYSTCDTCTGPDINCATNSPGLVMTISGLNGRTWNGISADGTYELCATDYAHDVYTVTYSSGKYTSTRGDEFWRLKNPSGANDLFSLKCEQVITGYTFIYVSIDNMTLFSNCGSHYSTTCVQQINVRPPTSEAKIKDFMAGTTGGALPNYNNGSVTIDGVTFSWHRADGTGRYPIWNNNP